MLTPLNRLIFHWAHALTVTGCEVRQVTDVTWEACGRKRITVLVTDTREWCLRAYKETSIVNNAARPCLGLLYLVDFFGVLSRQSHSTPAEGSWSETKGHRL